MIMTTAGGTADRLAMMAGVTVIATEIEIGTTATIDDGTTTTMTGGRAASGASDAVHPAGVYLEDLLDYTEITIETAEIATKAI